MSRSSLQKALKPITIFLPLMLVSGGLMLADEAPFLWWGLSGVLILVHLATTLPAGTPTQRPAWRYWSIGWISFAVVHAVIVSWSTTTWVKNHVATIDLLTIYLAAALLQQLAITAKQHTPESMAGLVPFSLAAAQYVAFRDFPGWMRSPLHPALLLVVAITVFITSDQFSKTTRTIWLLSGLGGIVTLLTAWPTAPNYFLFGEYFALLCVLLSLPVLSLLLRFSTGIAWRGVSVLMLVCALLAAAQVQLVWNHPPTGGSGKANGSQRRVVIDTDVSYDDVVAIRYLVRHPDIAVVGITTVDGVSRARDGATLVRQFLSLLGRDDIPVIAGTEQPLSAEQKQVPRWWQSVTTVALRPVLPSHTKMLSNTEMTASEFLQHVIADDPDATVLALGPLTNVTRAVTGGSGRGQVVISGGLIYPVGTIADLDWNIWLDPQAAAHVITAESLDLIVIPTDVTDGVRADASLVDVIRRRQSPDSRVIANMLLAMTLTGNRVPIWDAVAAAAYVKPELCEWESMAFAMEHEYMLPDEDAGDKPVRVCLDVDDDNVWQEVFSQKTQGDE